MRKFPAVGAPSGLVFMMMQRLIVALCGMVATF
jgi:hypothetical protein